VMLWRGSMLHINVPQPKLGGSAFSVFGLGLFSGAATACCAPVLAGAIALSATSGTIFGGLLLGVAYVAGTIVPLIPVAFAYKRAKRSMRDPQVTLRLGSRVKRIGVVRLLGTSVFAGFGVLFIALALTGASNSAPGFQKVLGSWMREVGVYVGHVPNFVSAPLLLAAVGGFIYAVLKKGSRNHERQEVQSSPAPECHSAEIKPRP
jgi:cytochrome c-type biogenesis protein